MKFVIYFLLIGLGVCSTTIPLGTRVPHGKLWKRVESWHEILGVSPDADDEEIKQAYKELALKNHPDKTKDPLSSERMKAINQAYQDSKEMSQRRTGTEGIRSPQASSPNKRKWTPQSSPNKARSGFGFGSSPHGASPDKSRSGFGFSSQGASPDKSQSGFGFSSQNASPNKSRPGFGFSSQGTSPDKSRSGFGFSPPRANSFWGSPRSDGARPAGQPDGSNPRYSSPPRSEQSFHTPQSSPSKGNPKSPDLSPMQALDLINKIQSPDRRKPR